MLYVLGLLLVEFVEKLARNLDMTKTKKKTNKLSEVETESQKETKREQKKYSTNKLFFFFLLVGNTIFNYSTFAIQP